eukprot:TRINITY_DN2056_c0_g1_i1.p1 TRINITY_DN2056_c0_g1~~TRINITY_DN2056_c0_g1_i1.p1  ORF type:complete len:299 (+),score=158.43 TRINITY_DN2056_c0_g1_i1:101-997(+)
MSLVTNVRPLHWVFKIANLKKTVDFLQNVLGMHVLRHEEFNQGCDASCNGPYQRPWSKTMIGFGPEIDHFVFELTYNYGVRGYPKGDDLRYITINGKDQILERAQQNGLTPIEENGDVFLEIPIDGYRVRLVNQETVSKDPVLSVSLNVADVARSEDFYSNVLGLKRFDATIGASDAEDSRVLLGYSDEFAKLELVQRANLKGQAINHEKAFGRVAFAIPEITPVVDAVAASGDKVLHAPVKLDTPGKATVEVIILQDRDDYEICFVGEAGFNDLSKPFDGAGNIDWAARAENGADKL